MQYVFQLPGEETLAITDSIAQSSMKLITVRHEQAAAFMAGVYGRLTGRAGVCLATLGPGATNLATGIADAHVDRAPLVALTGQAALQYVHKEFHQYVDVVSILRPITKWNTRIQKSETIPEAVRKSFSIAEAEKPGACHLEIPEDIAEEQVEGAPIPPTRPEQPRPLISMIKEAAQLIDRSQYPLILAGNGIIRGRASESFRTFVDKSKIAVAHTFMGKGSISDENELSLFTVGLQKRDHVTSAFEQADLVIAVGYDFVEYAPGVWNPSGSKTVVHIDTTAPEIDSNYQPNVQVVGQIGETLQTLAQFVKPRTSHYTKRLRDAIVSEIRERSAEEAYPMKPQRILHEIRAVMKKDDILVSDVGEHKLWVARIFPAYEPNTVIISNGYSSMGIGVPGAIAAKLVYPQRNVLTVCGDGGFLMTCHELETAVRLGLSFVAVIFRDGAYGSIKRKQLSKFGREAGVSFQNPDFVELAKAFGVRGYRPMQASELRPILEEALESSGPSVIDVPVNYS